DRCEFAGKETADCTDTFEIERAAVDVDGFLEQGLLFRLVRADVVDELLLRWRKTGLRVRRLGVLRARAACDNRCGADRGYDCAADGELAEYHDIRGTGLVCYPIACAECRKSGVANGPGSAGYGGHAIETNYVPQ